MDSDGGKTLFDHLPPSMGLDEVLQQVVKDDQEEWEYEYSTTETETYYLTIELSYPEFKEAATRAHHHSRGGYYKNWLDQHTTRDGAQGLGRDGNSDDDDDDDEPLPEPEDDADDDDADDMPMDPAVMNKGKGVDRGGSRPDKGKGREGEEADDGGGEDGAKDKDAGKETKEKEDIQILELHSHNPIISYRGRVFEGQWAEVIGTEAIMANREDNDPLHPLPALRNLPGNVDILGASASRILTKEKIVKPKIPEEDSLAAIRKEWNINIPRGKDKTGERGEQARFLENLIALKKKKGQTDQVTVYANAGEGKDFNDRKGPDFKPRRRKVTTGGNGADDEASQRSTPARRSGRRGGRPRGSRARATRARRGADSRVEDGYSYDPGMLSTPTPSHWGQLPKREDYGNYENDDDSNGEADEDDDDDVSMGD